MIFSKWAVSILAAITIAGAAPAEEATMKVGVGKKPITPQQSIWMAGYGARDKPSEGLLHDLYLKALAIEDESGTVSVLVTADIIGWPANVAHEIVALASKEFNLPRERLMLTSSHTHSGPVLFNNLRVMYVMQEGQRKVVEAYTEAFPGWTLDAIREALSNREPCRLSWGVGEAHFGKNRRKYTLDGVINDYNPIGPVDPDVPVLKVERLDGTLKAVAFGYACHNTVLDNYQLNGDYAGFAQLEIEKANPGAVALFTSGCGGDINPLPRKKVELAEQYGKDLAAAVQGVMDRDMAPVVGPIRAAYREITLALSEPPSKAHFEEQAKTATGIHQRLAQKYVNQIAEKGAVDTTYPFPVQAWKFAGGPLVTALGGESVVDYSLLLKHIYGRENQWVISYANDVCGYIPSLRVLREGGYEGEGAMLYYGFYGPWAPTVEQDILAAFAEIIPQVN